MSALAVHVGREGAPRGDITSMFAAMASRGTAWQERAERSRGGIRARLGVCGHDWERALTTRGGSGLAEVDDVIVIADATLYHVDDLLGRLRSAGVAVRGDTAAALILASYAAFGDDLIDHVEGDYAFSLWDARRDRLVAARDFGGKRPLYLAEMPDGGILLASSVGATLSDPRVDRSVDLTALASIAAGLWSHSDRTAHRGVRELSAGHCLVFEPGRPATVRERWRAPLRTLHRRQPLEDAARELRSLLVDACVERLAPSGPTGVSLSGGWDSPAVYGASQQALRDMEATSMRRGGSPRSVLPVSMSYPEGDPGREDELIDAIVAHWGGQTRWIAVDDVSMFDDPGGSARRRDLPMAHAYESWNRALYREARTAGARVLLDGLGGDQLFQVTDIFLSDLFRRGQWIELARQYRARRDGDGDLRSLYRWAIRPVLPSPLVELVARLRRSGPVRHYLDRDPPFWFSEPFLERHGVRERERSARPRLPRGDAVLAESHAFLRFPFYPRIVAMLHSFGLDEGVEVRSPLLDERVVRFAMARPWSERADGRETKILLRRAMRGLLPDHVLAPRPHRTGVTSAYFLRQLRGPGRSLVDDVLADSRLADMGMIELRRLRRAWEHVLAQDDDEMGIRIFFTVQAELWLRTREGS